MSGLVAGLDVSGRPGQHDLYLSIVIGVDEYVRSLVRSLGYERIHMSRMPKKARRSIISALRFHSKDCIAFCIRTDRGRIVDRVIRMRRARSRYAMSGRVLQSYNRLLLKEVLDKIQKFLAMHGCALPDLVFQCDGDCIGFARDAGLTYANTGQTGDGDAHTLADIIAWGNNKKMEPKNVIRIDAAGKIERILAGSLSKR